MMYLIRNHSQQNLGNVKLNYQVGFAESEPVPPLSEVEVPITQEILSVTVNQTTVLVGESIVVTLANGTKVRVNPLIQQNLVDVFDEDES